MFITADRVLYSFIGKLSLILLGVGLLFLGKAFWLTLEMRGGEGK